MFRRWPFLSGFTGLAIIFAPASVQSQGPPLTTTEASAEHSCGQTALFVLMRLLHCDVDFASVRRELPAGEDGQVSLAHMREAADKLGLSLTAHRLKGGDLLKLPGPYIELVPPVSPRSQFGHYRVLRRVAPDVGLQVIDAPRSLALISPEELQRHSASQFVVLVPDTESPWRKTQLGGLVGLL